MVGKIEEKKNKAEKGIGCEQSPSPQIENKPWIGIFERVDHRAFAKKYNIHNYFPWRLMTEDDWPQQKRINEIKRRKPGISDKEVTQILIGMDSGSEEDYEEDEEDEESINPDVFFDDDSIVKEEDGDNHEGLAEYEIRQHELEERVMYATMKYFEEGIRVDLDTMEEKEPRRRKIDAHGSDEPFKGDNNDVAAKDNKDDGMDAGRKRERTASGSSIGNLEKKAKLPIEGSLPEPQIDDADDEPERAMILALKSDEDNKDKEE